MNSKSYANSGGYKEEEIGYSTSNLLKRLRKVEADVKEANLLAHPTTSKQQRLEANAFVQAPLVDADSYSFEYSESTSLTQELSVSRIDSPKKAVKPSIRKGQDAWFVLIALYIKGEGQQSSELEVEKELLNINPKSRGGVGASLEKAVQAGLAVRRGRSFALTASGFKKSEGFYYDYLAGEVKAEPIRSSKPKTVAGDSRVSSSIVLEASAAPASRNEIALEEFTFAFDVPSSPSLRVSASSSALSLAPALKSRPTTAHVVSVTGASEVIDLLDSDDEDQKQGCKVVAKPQEEVIDLCASPPSAVAASSSGPSLIQRLRSIAAEKRLETAAPAVASSSQAAATSSSSSVLGRREAVSHASGLRPMTLSDERPNKVPWSEHYNGLVPLPLPRELYEVVLVVDERERQKDFVDGNLNCAYCRSTLAIGDFIFVGRPRGNDGMNGAVVLDCIIERKIPNDLASSICDGRYAEQKTRMRACGLAHMMYLVEGELILTRARIPPGALRTCVGATPVRAAVLSQCVCVADCSRRLLMTSVSCGRDLSTTPCRCWTRCTSKQQIYL